MSKKAQTIPNSEIIAKRRFIRTTPDKMRFAASLIKGRKLLAALGILKFSHLAAAKPLELTLKQGASQAKDQSIEGEDLTVWRILINEGPKLKRRRIHSGILKVLDVMGIQSPVVRLHYYLL